MRAGLDRVLKALLDQFISLLTFVSSL